MKDTSKTKKQLIAELEELRQQRAIEQAAENVREEVLSMRSTGDLARVVAVMQGELKKLGVETPATSIAFMNAETESSIYYTAFRPAELDLPVDFFLNTIAVDDEIAVKVSEFAFGERSEDQLAPWRRQEQVVAREFLNRDAATELAYSNQFHPREDAEEEQRERLLEAWLGEWFVTRVPTEHGVVSIRERAFSEEHAAFISHLAASLSLGYVRFLDFQRLEEQNRALEEANVQIQEQTQRKSASLASMSHDLRTPMNAIIGYTRILLRRTADRLDEREQRNLRNIQTSSNNLLALINEILDLSRIEAGRVEINRVDVDLKQLVSECATSVTPLLEAGVELKQELADVDRIHTDQDVLRRVVMNVLGNAVKFTEEGSITVSMKSVGGWVELSVADTGSGIPPEDLPYIFDEFRQVESEEEKREGTGLGLSNAKKLVELLGGTISVESEVGKGTQFTLRLTDYEENNAE